MSIRHLLARQVTDYWYGRAQPLWLILLSPLCYALSLLYRFVVYLRQVCYQLGLFKTYYSPIPVIIVGNIISGGSAKTPTVIALVQYLKTLGYHPGVVSRGYGGDKVTARPRYVVATDNPKAVGDEPYLISLATQVPVVVAKNRVLAAQYLLYHCDVIVSDDGMQHYALGRDIEIAMIDGHQGLGNALCLPAGPLREAKGRLNSVDWLLIKENSSDFSSLWPYLTRLSQKHRHATLTIKQQALRRVNQEHQRCELSNLRRQFDTLHAVAGIAHPESFFASLEAAGFKVIAHPYADHQTLKLKQLQFDDDYPVVMTAKDAIKYRHLKLTKHWYLPIVAEFDSEFKQWLLNRLSMR